MTPKETLQLVAKKGAFLLLALIVIMASAGSLNYGVMPGHWPYILAGILNLGVAGYILYKIFKRN